MTDKPKVHVTINDLDSEGKPEPFVFGVNNKRITFPDLFDMEFEAAEEFLNDLNTESNSDVLQKWLSAEDYKNLKAAKLSLRQIGILLEKVMAHYQGIAGDPEKGDASENS